MRKGKYVQIWIGESRLPEFQAFKNSCEAKGKSLTDGIMELISASCAPSRRVQAQKSVMDLRKNTQTCVLCKKEVANMVSAEGKAMCQFCACTLPDEHLCKICMMISVKPCVNEICQTCQEDLKNE